MALSDLPLAELEKLTPAREEPADFDQFWDRTLADSRLHPMTPKVEAVSVGLTTVEVFDVTFPGFLGDPIKGWLLVPAGTAGSTRRLPAVVHYIGYGGGRGLPHEWL